eukprot:NODE_603_length_5511_cov_0.288987.p1 type:complete len:873 gc:universal NODE_603_length_5511_cov_0.288987:3357-739(-)
MKKIIDENQKSKMEIPSILQISSLSQSEFKNWIKNIWERSDKHVKPPIQKRPPRSEAYEKTIPALHLDAGIIVNTPIFDLFSLIVKNANLENDPTTIWEYMFKALIGHIKKHEMKHFLKIIRDFGLDFLYRFPDASHSQQIIALKKSIEKIVPFGDTHTIDDVVFNNCIKWLPNHKSYGFRDIPNESIKFGGEMLKNILKNILQLMISTGFVPTQFGDSTLIPIPKVTNAAGMDQHRGISLLYTIRKLFEYYIYHTIHIRFPANQFGFASKSSIHDALSHFSRIISSRNRNHERVKYICLIDLKKAYDNINRSYLLNLYQQYNKYLVRLALHIVRITNQSMMLLQKMSEKINTTSGIPQGSSLSPSIFAYCLNDLYLVQNESVRSIFYADDIALLCYSKEALEEAIDQIIECANVIGLSISIQKSVIITSNNRLEPSIRGILVTSNTQRYLGYWVNLSGIDRKMMFNKKLERMNCKMHELRKLGVFRLGLPLEICSTLLTSHLTPCIDFGFQNVMFKDTQHKNLQVKVRKYMKSLLHSIKSIPTNLLKSICVYPNTIKRNTYLRKKQEVHYSWRFGKDYSNVSFSRESGLFKFHPYIIENPHSGISKLLKWDFRPNDRNTCRICRQFHPYVQKKLQCFQNNRGFFDYLPSLTNRQMQPPASNNENDHEYSNTIDCNYNGYTFMTDASLNGNYMGIGITLSAPNSINIINEYQFKLQNTSNYNIPSSTELECIGIDKCLELANHLHLSKFRIYCDNQASVKVANYLLKGNDPSKHALHKAYPHINQFISQNTLQIIWCKGHNGNYLNDRADWLSKNAHNAFVIPFDSVSSMKKKLQNNLFLFQNSLNLDRLNTRHKLILNTRVREFMRIMRLH